ncbi:MAG: GNAT family N-acetyltransferase [Methanobacterium sp.]|nr:GNAT family N-acetyltransferase [Methanobacterium sp.]
MKFEKLDIKKHSPYKVAELLYETDQSIFNFLYGNKANAAKILEKLVSLGGNNLGHENIYVVTQNEMVIGVLLYFGGNHHKFGELKFLFKNLNPVDAFRFLLIDLKDSLILSHLNKCDFYLAGVAVDEEFRGQGVGSLLLEEGVNMARKRGCERVVLDVALDNPGAKRLYERIGFKVFNKRSYPWFRGKVGMFNMELNLK